jgi:hypothetical protein
MNSKRHPHSDRRQAGVMPRVPFKDSNGATIMECRIRIPDRRLNNIEVEWIKSS